MLSTSHPAGLQNKVFIDIMMYLCNRGRENLRNMTKNAFLILTDSARLRYVSVVDKQTKNHHGQDDEDVSQQGRMYQLPGNPMCPVLSFEKYIAKLNSKLDCFLLVTCYLRMMGYVAVSFKCPYLASVDPACS